MVCAKLIITIFCIWFPLSLWIFFFSLRNIFWCTHFFKTCIYLIFLQVYSFKLFIIDEVMCNIIKGVYIQHVCSYCVFRMFIHSAFLECLFTVHPKCSFIGCLECSFQVCNHVFKKFVYRMFLSIHWPCFHNVC